MSPDNLITIANNIVKPSSILSMVKQNYAVLNYFLTNEPYEDYLTVEITFKLDSLKFQDFYKVLKWLQYKDEQQPDVHLIEYLDWDDVKNNDFQSSIYQLSFKIIKQDLSNDIFQAIKNKTYFQSQLVHFNGYKDNYYNVYQNRCQNNLKYITSYIEKLISGTINAKYFN